MHLGKTCPDTGWGQGWSTCGIALGSHKEIAKSRPQGPKSKAFLSPGHCFLLSQALWLQSCLNTSEREGSTPDCSGLFTLRCWLVPARSHPNSSSQSHPGSPWLRCCYRNAQFPLQTEKDKMGFYSPTLFSFTSNPRFLCSASRLLGRRWRESHPAKLRGRIAASA